MMIVTRHYKKATNAMLPIPSILVKRTGGFTLLEVMIALVILSVGLLGLAALQLVAIRGNSFSSEMTYATMLAQQHAEILKGLPFNDANLAPADEQNPHTAIGSSKGVQYAVRWTIADNTPDTDMKTVNLTVQWTSLRQGTSSEAGTVTARLRTIIRNQS
jgi:type IV pilus assembly protein PilV